MIKSICSAIFLSFLLVSCSGDSSKDSARESLTASLNVEDLVEIQQAFIKCKESSTEPHSCKEFVAKSIATYYGYEFMGANDLPLPYDKLSEVVVASNAWKEIGDANEQSTLTTAQQNANKGIPTLAVNASNNTLAIVIKGELTHSNSLGLDCPAVAVFRPKRFKKSFVGKGINYAWSDLSRVKLYTLK